jgi:hypothetical protein
MNDKVPEPSGNVPKKIYMCKDFLPVTFLLGSEIFVINSQEPSRKVTAFQNTKCS